MEEQRAELPNLKTKNGGKNISNISIFTYLLALINIEAVLTRIFEVGSAVWRTRVCICCSIYCSRTFAHGVERVHTVSCNSVEFIIYSYFN